MKTRLLNEAELLLLQHWEEAHSLEQTMGRVREKYGALLAHAAEVIAQSHPELDSNRVYATQLWSKGSITFGRKVWPDGDDSYRLPGFWMVNLRLELLAAETAPPPTTSIWIHPKTMKKAQLNPVAVKQQLRAAATELLTTEELDRNVRDDGSGNGLIYFAAPSKQQILEMFVTDDGESLVEMLVNQFDMLSRFVPVLDRILGALTQP